MTTRKQITAEARKTIADAITKPQAIRAGLLIASCKMWSRNEASAVGCAKSANDIADALELYGITGTSLSYIREVARWRTHYDYPRPHDQSVVIFEVLPPG